MIGLGTRLGLLELAVTFKVWFSLAAPELIPVRVTVCRPAAAFAVKLARGSRVGVSLTELTVKTKLSLAVSPSLLLTVMVMMVVPDWSGSGVRVAVRLPEVPVIL